VAVVTSSDRSRIVPVFSLSNVAFASAFCAVMTTSVQHVQQSSWQVRVHGHACISQTGPSIPSFRIA